MVRDTKELLVGAFSFGGGIGGGFLEETAANLKTLSEAKREDEEEGCFCPAPTPVVVAIGVQLGGGRGRCPERVSGRRVLYGKDLTDTSPGFRIRIHAQISIWLCLVA